MEGRHLADWRAKVRDAIGAADGDNHEPVRTTHQHWHHHGEDSGVRGLDDAGGHVHQHSHGKRPDSKHLLTEDNDHGHDHTDVDYGPGGDDPGMSRPDGLPGTTGKQVTEIRAGPAAAFGPAPAPVLVLNRAGAPKPPPSPARAEAAWARLTVTARQIAPRRKR